MNGTADDKSAAIVERIGEIAVKVGQFIAALPDGAAVSNAPGAVVGDPVSEALQSLVGETHSFDMVLSSVANQGLRTLAIANDNLGNPTLYLVVSVRTASPSGEIPGCEAPAAAGLCEGDGVYFRTNSPYVFEYALTTDSSDGAHSAAVARIDGTLYAPDESATFFLPLRRHAFVKTSDKLTFAGGVLTGAEFDRPSEVLGFLDIPFAAVEKAMLIPANAIGAIFGGGSAPPPAPAPADPATDTPPVSAD